MNLVFWITGLFFALCLAYPVWLMLLPRWVPAPAKKDPTDEGVSLIIPCYNEQHRIRDKIEALLQELACFPHCEVLVIDNCSTDNTRSILLEYKAHPRVKLIFKDKQLGIPHSMNLGITLARYERVVFSDVRQQLTCQVIRRLLVPLDDPTVSGVSASLAAKTGKKYSILRMYENLLKKLESRSGNLIGVYGPLYAIKKSCYRPIPENIILDDLYNGLNILASGKVLFRDNCRIIDDDFTKLYDYTRSKRYLLGLLQIIGHKPLMKRLNNRQRFMLYWHKYLRLVLPLLLLCCYLSLGLLGLRSPGFLVLFGIMSLAGVLAIWPALNRFNFKLRDFARINIYYTGAMIALLFNHRSRKTANLPPIKNTSL